VPDAGEFGGVPFGVYDALDVLMAVFDLDGRVRYASPRTRARWTRRGITVGGEGSFSPPVVVLGENGAVLAEEDFPLTRTLRTGEEVHGEVIGTRGADGTVYWDVVSTVAFFGSETGDMIGVVATNIDVTESHHAQAAALAEAERFRFLAERCSDVMYRIEVGPPLRLEYVNPAIERLCGYSPDEFYADPSLMYSVVHEDDRGKLLAAAQHATSPVEMMLLRLFHRDGRLLWVEEQIVMIRDTSGAVVAFEGIIRDVTAAKEKEAHLTAQALHDPLTRLAHRVLFVDRLGYALARIRRHPGFVAVLYLDIDRFKTINDNLGHDTGDQVLQAVARRLAETVRPSDSVARLGGDEFAAILSDLDGPGEATQIAGRLLRAVAEPIDLTDGALVATVSIGVAVTDDDTITAAELLQRADLAMYQAKDNGRARVESWSNHDVAGIWASLPG
jgi:diguanylate cyclase (GGDEF)-like protein/PAS domain S-box-containing protein